MNKLIGEIIGTEKIKGENFESYVYKMKTLAEREVEIISLKPLKLGCGYIFALKNLEIRDEDKYMVSDETEVNFSPLNNMRKYNDYR